MSAAASAAGDRVGDLAAVPAADDGAVAAEPAGHRARGGRRASSASPTAQLEADLELLFVCGTPGHMPDDLIEAEWEGGRVYLGNADTIARPLRLGVDEALALIVGLRALAAVPGPGGARRRRPRPRQARGGHRQRARRPAPAIQVSIEGDVEAESAGHRPHGARRPPAAAPALPRGRPATRRPSATSTRCGWSTSTRTGTSRAGATGPRASGCSGSTGSRRSRSSTTTAPRRRTPARATWTPASSRPARPTCWSGCGWSPGAAWVSDYYPTERVEWLDGRQLAGVAAHRRHRLAAPAAVAAGVAGDRPGAGLPRGRGARRRRGGPARLRGPRPDLAARRVGWSACGGGC